MKKIVDAKILQTAFSGDLVVGCRQVRKELALGNLRCVFVAGDIDGALKRELNALLSTACVDVFRVKSKEELGRRAGIEVDAAIVGVLKKSVKQ